ncbi:hypothetical protein EDD18DRAFT_204112 [Armillaria luteobubalina]|uniref:Uncharacterized protein n=1 Tax=Armillaria luteobubalina TaxID=153913 RepID=A0AA39UT77_9AGAR|nr:hypothetical protein EDD18DRAFT_204112 [Armillaria luteobubalina]
MNSSMKARFQTILLRINTKITDIYHDEVDLSSTCTNTPTLAHYTPPPDPDPEVFEVPRASPAPSRLTFLAIWDPESQRYTLPLIPRGQHKEEGFFCTCNHPDHLEREPHLHSRFSISTTSTSNFIEVSEPQTPQAFSNANGKPPIVQPVPRRPGLSRSCPLFPSRPREDRSSVCFVSTLTHKFNFSCTNLLLRSCLPGYSRRTSSMSSPPPRSSSLSPSPLGFLKCKTAQSQREDEDAWVNIDVECIIRERIVYI